jgi:Tol biopolymer transport system component
MPLNLQPALNKGIRESINEFDLDGARKALEFALRQKPDAETYYLASMLAETEKEKLKYLEKALDKDPFHEEAFAEYEHFTKQTLPTTKSPQKAKKHLKTASANNWSAACYQLGYFIACGAGIVALGLLAPVIAAASVPAVIIGAVLAGVLVLGAGLGTIFKSVTAEHRITETLMEETSENFRANRRGDSPIKKGTDFMQTAAGKAVTSIAVVGLAGAVVLSNNSSLQHYDSEYQNNNSIIQLSSESGNNQSIEENETNDSQICQPGVLVFSARLNSSLNQSIYTMDTSGNTLNRLTDDSYYAINPDWSPDGKQILFESNRGNGGIFIMNENGGNLHLLVEEGREPDWSPDGKHLVYRIDRELFVYNIEQDVSAQITFDNRHKQLPRYSPDGTRIVFDTYHSSGAGKGLWIVDANGDNLMQLVRNRAVAPVWSNDGNTIMYDEFAIFLAPLNDFENTMKIIEHKSGTATWSPDGKCIVFSSDTDKDIFLLRLSDMRLENITQTGQGYQHASYRP